MGPELGLPFMYTPGKALSAWVSKRHPLTSSSDDLASRDLGQLEVQTSRSLPPASPPLPGLRAQK